MLNIEDVADSVCDVINTNFQDHFTAQRTLRPRLDVKNLSTLTVRVVPNREETIKIARGDHYQNDFWIDISVHKRVDSEDDADEVMDVARQIKDYFKTNPGAISGVRAFRWDRVPYVPEHWDESRVASSIITIMFRDVRR